MRFSDGIDIEPEAPKDPAPKIPKPVGKILTEKVKSLVFWAGTVCASISAVAYMLIVIVMSVGFKAETSIESNIGFALATAFVGFLISQFLKWQGINFAKNEPEVKEIWDKYYRRESPKRKYRPLASFWRRSIVFDLLLKSLSILIVTVGTAYIFIEASGDPARIFMAIFNLTLFIGFGLMSLSKAYDFTKEEHVAYMERQMELEGADDGDTDK